jgi:phosphinothricin acetyltransferase
MSDNLIRRPEQADLPVLLDIYNHYVIHTPVTFDIEPRTLAQRQEWFDTFKHTGRYQCFVAEKSGSPVGWASSHRFHERAAYDTSVSVSVYLGPGHQRKGLGRRLYMALFDALEREDVHRIYGSITLPNPGSVGLHEAMGFVRIGVQSEVGRKFGKFWDIELYERVFQPSSTRP